MIFYFDSQRDNPYDAALMTSTLSQRRLPRYVCPRKFVNLGAEISGNLAISELSRLCGLLASNEGDAIVNLTFSEDCQHDGQLNGHAAADLSLVCQRCLEVFSLPVKCRFALMMVNSEQQAVDLSDPWEPLFIDGREIDLHQLIEDEFLLALPSVAYHPQGCVNSDLLSYSGGLDSDLAGHGTDRDGLIMGDRSVNPFEVLKVLKEPNN